MHPFVYTLNTSTIQPVPLLDKIRLAADAGFEAIEPWNDEVDAHLARGGTLPEITRALADSGLRVLGMIALGDWALTEGLAYHRALDDCRRRMDQAAALGSPHIVASPPQDDLPLDRAITRFAALQRLGDGAGVVPSMEFLGFVDGVHTLDRALAIALGTGDPRATIVADVFHLIRGGGSLDDLLILPGTRLAGFHLNDLPPTPDPLTQSDADRVLPGDGIADLPRAIAHLRAIGYDGPLSLELFNPDLWRRDPAEVLSIGLRRMRDLVERG